MATSSHHESNERAEWHHLDARNKVLGRLATQAAQLLLGKHRVDSRPHVVVPVYVVVTNSDEVVLTGTKERNKLYRRYTGYPGGLRERTAEEVRRLDSRRLIIEAVTGMLPKNSLRAERLKHLKVYATAEHPHEAQLKNVTS
jgi:large subunit ribosomal protein L13